MIDIDHFKQVNDTYGHDVGDKMLVQLSRKFEQATRNSDYISRWGGEEFLICCTTISENDLFTIAENINELVKRADVALYAAKNNGRNQTVVSEFAPLWTDVSPG